MEAGPTKTRAQPSPRRRPLHPRSPRTSDPPRPVSTPANIERPILPESSNIRPSTANNSQQNCLTIHNSSKNENPVNVASKQKSPALSNSPKKAPNSTRREEDDGDNAPVPQTKVHVSGFAPYTQRQDLSQIFSRFGSMRVEKFNARHSYAIIKFNTEEEAKYAIEQTNNQKYIYGDALHVRTYTAVGAQQALKRKFTHSKRREEIIEPQKIDLSGDFYEQMQRILFSVRLTQEEATNVSLLYADVERVLQAVWPGCVAMPFGSITTGLGIKSSDADCFVHLPPAIHRSTPGCVLVNRAKNVLKNYPTLFTEILSIPRANTPIVKLFHLPTSTNCDISFKTPLGTQNSKLIAFLLHADPRLLPLSVLIKYWAKVHGLSGSGKLTNYALTMMIIFYLQQPPMSILPPVKWLQRDPKNDMIVDYWNAGFVDNKEILPPCTNTSSIPELLGGFFEYYSKFDFENMVICPYLGKTVEKKLFDDMSKLPADFDRYVQNVTDELVLPIRIGTPFVVQDPFDQSHNVASPISEKLASDIKEFLKFAANCYDSEKLNGCSKFLETILLQKPKIIKKNSHPQFRVGIFARLIQNIVDPDWKGIVRKIVLDIFQTLLKIKLEKDKEKMNPETKKEKEIYKGTITKKIWKRKRFNKTYNRFMNIDFADKQRMITEDVMKVEKDVIEIHFTLGISYSLEHKSAATMIKLLKGDVGHFEEFARFHLNSMQEWFTILVKPHTSTSGGVTTQETADIDTQLDNGESDDADTTTENIDTNTAESESEKENEDQDDDDECTNNVN